jgi:hypothetical protein
LRPSRLAPITVVLLLSPAARAADYEISAETIGQGYQLRAADDTLVNRRRLVQSLGLDVYNIGPKDVVGRPLARNQLYLTVAMRFDAELGDFDSLRELAGRTHQDELHAARFDLLYAYLGGTNVFGFLDFRLGRQLLVDLFDYLAFDGLHLAARTSFNLAVEAWGGLAVSGAMPFDSPLYRADGVALGGNPLGSLGARQEDALQPTFGVALKTVDLPWAAARVSYFRTISTTQSRGPGEPDTGVVDEKVALTARARLAGGRLFLWAGARYNVLAGRVDEIQGGARLKLAAAHALQAEYVYSAPTFDGDSIWNVFASEAFNDVRLSYQAMLGRLELYARGLVRLFADQVTSQDCSDPAAAGVSSPLSAGGNLGGRLALPRGWLRLDGYYQDGWGGRTAGVDLAGRWTILDRLGLDGRVSYASFRDDARSLDHADSLGLALGLRYTLVSGITAHLLIEENVNRLYASQLRIVGLLDLSFFLGPRGGGRVRPRAGWL